VSTRGRGVSLMSSAVQGPFPWAGLHPRFCPEPARPAAAWVKRTASGAPSRCQSGGPDRPLSARGSYPGRRKLHGTSARFPERRASR
jgi:hypothetical protein